MMLVASKNSLSNKQLLLVQKAWVSVCRKFKMTSRESEMAIVECKIKEGGPLEMYSAKINRSSRK